MPRVPSADETRNREERHVIGNKSDKGQSSIAATRSLVSYAKGLLGLKTGGGNVYWVDGTATGAADGSDLTNAYATIAAAITASNATIDWSATPKKFNWILISPGLYAEALTSLPYYCHMIGLGLIGTDTAAEIHPASGVALTGTALGLHMANLWIEAGGTNICMDSKTMQNCLIEDCMFYSGGTGTYGIRTGSGTSATGMKSSVIRRCRFGTGSTKLTHGIYCVGGADVYFHNSIVEDCVIWAGTAGIWVQDTCTATNTLIKNNFIARPTKGIDDNNGGTYCIGNWITASSDAIEHANSGTQCIDNHVINNATGAVELTGTS